jgi:MYXO-CTERM domain-containing protein
MAVVLTLLLLQTTPGLQAEYWENTAPPGTPSNPPAVPTTAPTQNPIQTVLDFSDGPNNTNAPTAPILPWVCSPVDNFFARWTGFIRGPVNGSVTFETLTDDGVELRVDDTVVLVNWTFHGETTNTGTFQMTQDVWYPIQLLFFEGTGGARMRLRWSYAGQALQVIPDTHPSATPPPPPPTPTISAAQGANFSTDINVSWTNSGSGVTYTLQRSENGGAFAPVGGPMTGLSFTDTNREYGRTYCYQVQATQSGQSSPFSSPAACVMLALPPPRTAGDNNEGFFEDNCSCGASTSPSGAVFAALAGLFAGTLRRRRPAVH